MHNDCGVVAFSSRWFWFVVGGWVVLFGVVLVWFDWFTVCMVCLGCWFGLVGLGFVAFLLVLYLVGCTLVGCFGIVCVFGGSCAIAIVFVLGFEF